MIPIRAMIALTCTFSAPYRAAAVKLTSSLHEQPIDTCTRDKLGNGSLLRTSRNVMAQHDMDVSGYQRPDRVFVDLFIHPPAKFAFCLIEKMRAVAWAPCSLKLLG